MIRVSCSQVGRFSCLNPVHFGLSHIVTLVAMSLCNEKFSFSDELHCPFSHFFLSWNGELCKISLMLLFYTDVICCVAVILTNTCKFFGFLYLNYPYTS